MADIQPTVEDQRARDAWRETIVDVFETPEEQENAMKIIGESEGIDFNTAVKVDKDAEEVEKAAAAVEEKKAEAEDELKIEDEKEDKVEEKAEAETEPEEEKKAEPEEDEEVKKAQEAADELQKHIEDRNKKIADLEAEVALSKSDAAIRQEVSDKMSDAVNKYKQDQENVQESVAKFEEEHGKEAADELRKKHEEIFALRQKAIEREWQDEVNKLSAASRAEIDDQKNNLNNLSLNPEISKWYLEGKTDYDAGNQTSEAVARWNLAASMDAVLESDPAWKDKPTEEKLTEIVRRVKLSRGEETTDPAAEAKTEEKTEEKKAETEDKIAEEIKKQAKGDSAVPTSLSEVTGSQPETDGLTLEKLSKMDPIDMMKMSTEKLDAIAAKAMEKAAN